MQFGMRGVQVGDICVTFDPIVFKVISGDSVRLQIFWEDDFQAGTPCTKAACNSKMVGELLETWGH